MSAPSDETPAGGSVTGEIRFRARNREGRTSATETFLP
jgi:hypothetical protein